MKKNRFDHLSTIADTKTALKHIFHVAADNRRATLELQNQIEELKVRSLKLKNAMVNEISFVFFLSIFSIKTQLKKNNVRILLAMLNA